MKKPDRFERAVREITKSDTDIGYDALCFPDDVIALLRGEHAWMRRMVEDVQEWGERNEVVTKEDISVVILEHLNQRRK